jgi:hypothetical protein
VAKVAFQPSGGPAAQEHYRDTIERPVSLAANADLLGPHLAPLQRLYPSGQAPLWGVTPGIAGTNVKKYGRLETGDVVLFTGQGHAYAGGVVTYLLHSADLARRLWGVDDRGQTWENVYALTEVWPLDVPYASFNAAAGYDVDYNHLGFNVLDEERSRRVIEALGPGELPFVHSPSFGSRVGQRATAKVTAPGLPYTPVDETVKTRPREPFAVDPDEVDRGTQGHRRTQNALAAYLKSQGIKALKPGSAGPAYDLAWQKGGTLFVAEIKSLTMRNESKQLRLALGQVLDYADQLVRQGHNVRAVIAAEIEPGERRWVELCLSLGVTLVWPGRFDALG